SIGQLPDDHPLFAALEALETELDALESALAGQAERAESIGACLRRARELQAVLAGWTTPPTELEREAADAAPGATTEGKGERADPNEKVRWIEVFAHTVQL
ncbi:ATP-dependent DNA helicase, partial [Mesorhizobium sp. M3A.F.Ca.ET.174.01.1.1]